MGLRGGWAAARVTLERLWRVRGLGALAVLVVAVALLRPGPEPESRVTVVLHHVPASTATHGMPGVRPSIGERIFWRTLKPDTVWMTDTGATRLVMDFCRPLIVPPIPDTSRLAPTAALLLLTAGDVDGRRLGLYGVISSGTLWRQATTLREDHGGIRWRADGDSVVVRERRRFRLLGLRPTLGAGGGLVVGLDGRAGLGGFAGLVLVR